MIILQLRRYLPDCTVSQLYFPGEALPFCYALEDIARPANVKCSGETCIPEGLYHVIITPSQRFKKDMILLYNTPDLEVERDGKRFTGVRVHGGNVVADTEGCPLVGFNYNGQSRVWESASDAVHDKVRALLTQHPKVYWVITS